MNYQLKSNNKFKSLASSLRSFWPLLAPEKKLLIGALTTIVISSAANIVAPLLIGRAIDTYIQAKNYSGILATAGILLLIYLCAVVATYLQTKWMGTVGQNLLKTLRQKVFVTLQNLPLAFFNQNKTGDLISRINNDTDKLNQFFSQVLVRFVANVFMMTGTGIFMIILNWRLGLVTLLPALGLLIFTQLISSWIKQQNTASLKATGGLSAEITESLENFKLLVVYGRRDFFESKFAEANQNNYQKAIRAGIANNSLTPIYGFASGLAQLLTIFFGISLIIQGELTIGILVSYLAYVSRFYDPIRQLANIWSTFQVALAGWERIREILDLKSNLKIQKRGKTSNRKALIEFRKVSFGYDADTEILHNISLLLERGKTYAFVGPTGGGKTTTASLMARLYDPTKGTVYFNGQDIKSISTLERAEKIGFILQEPFLFTGTIAENILYGNREYKNLSKEELQNLLTQFGLEKVLNRFPEGLDTKVTTQATSLSLGQQQLIAFIRAILRKPELLILDEATANVDTITEQLLQDILDTLPQETTKVVIAHRFNTIESADQVFFVNAGNVIAAGSLEHAMELLLEDKRTS